jgi:hypothetical protein
MKRNVLIALFALTATAAIYGSGDGKKSAKPKAKTECCQKPPNCCVK